MQANAAKGKVKHLKKETKMLQVFPLNISNSITSRKLGEFFPFNSSDSHIC